MVNQLEFGLLVSWNPEQIKGKPYKEQAVGHSAVKPWLILVAGHQLPGAIFEILGRRGFQGLQARGWLFFCRSGRM